MSRFFLRKGGKPPAPPFEDVMQEAATWAVSDMKGVSFDSVRSSQFQRLFDFIDGRHIPMTVPVVMSEVAGKYTMWFKIDPEHASRATDAPGVRIVHTDARKMRVYAFDGFLVYANDGGVQHAVKMLRDAGVAVEDGNYLVAQYNSPLAPYRHNEVWIPHSEGKP